MSAPQATKPTSAEIEEALKEIERKKRERVITEALRNAGISVTRTWNIVDENAEDG